MGSADQQSEQVRHRRQGPGRFVAPVTKQMRSGHENLSASLVRRGGRRGCKILCLRFSGRTLDRVSTLPSDSPSGPAGSVKIVDFRLFGQRLQAISAGPHHEFNDAISLVVLCADQAELDRSWDALLRDGGRPQACGWLIDRYGVRWQIVPAMLDEMMQREDQAASKRLSDALLKMVKLHIAALERAYRGDAAVA